MAVTDQILPRLRRTLQTIFGIGTVQLKDSSGTLQFRNSADSAYADSASKQVRVQGSNASNAIVLAAPAGLGSNVTFTFPSAVGSTNQVLADVGGDGTLGFIDVSSNADLVQKQAYTEATASPTTIFAAAANTEILEIAVEVDVAAGGGAPTIKVGVTGTDNKFIDTTDTDLKTTGKYNIPVYDTVGGSPINVILTITPDSQTFSGNVYVRYATPA